MPVTATLGPSVHLLTETLLRIQVRREAGLSGRGGRHARGGVARPAGFTDRQLVEIPLAISAILFTNMVNRINDTVVDFPKVA